MMFFRNARVVISVVAAIFAMIFMLFFNVILSTHLTDAPISLQEDQAGYIMAIPAFTYAIAASFVGVLFKGVPRRYLTQIAFIVSTVALFLFGPS